MDRRSIVIGLCAVAAAVLLQSSGARAQAGAGALGTVRLPRAVLANGQPLPAGTYSVRLTAEPVTAVVGQTTSESRWVEFVQNDQVRGRDMATVLGAAEVKEIGGGAPAAGRTKVELLRGGDYVRVWIKDKGTHYLVHLPVQGK